MSGISRPSSRVHLEASRPSVPVRPREAERLGRPRYGCHTSGIDMLQGRVRFVTCCGVWTTVPKTALRRRARKGAAEFDMPVEDGSQLLRNSRPTGVFMTNLLVRILRIQIRSFVKFAAFVALLIAYFLYMAWKFDASTGAWLALMSWSFFVLCTPVADGGFIIAFPVRLLFGTRMIVEHPCPVGLGNGAFHLVWG